MIRGDATAIVIGQLGFVVLPEKMYMRIMCAAEGKSSITDRAIVDLLDHGGRWHISEIAQTLRGAASYTDWASRQCKRLTDIGKISRVGRGTYGRRGL